MIDRPAQPPRIPPARLDEYELVIDVKIMRSTDFDRIRAYTRIRVPLTKLAGLLATRTAREVTMAAVGNAIGELIEENVDG